MKIFLPNQHFIAVDEKPNKKNMPEIKINDFRNMQKILNLNSDLHCKMNAGTFKKSVANYFTLVEAAGGVVNMEDKILFIFRNGKWDLPKGKIEIKERKKNAATREVEEETGLKNLHIKNKIAESFHIYLFENKTWTFKITYWYAMDCPYKQKLVPQTEEGITEIKWVSVNRLNSVLSNTYPLIKKLIEKIV